VALGESEREQGGDETVEVRRVTANRSDSHDAVTSPLTPA
jgi:hypothetical protein